MFANIAPAAIFILGSLATRVAAFDINCNNNLVLYWGTNSYFNTHGGSPQEGQLALKEYCATGSVDVIVMSFLETLNVGSLPVIDIGWQCDIKDSTNLFPGTNLAHCPQVASDIKYCQSKGVIVLLSIGGGAGSVTLSGQQDGETFAQTLWDIFGGGSSKTRPFDNVKLDGFDLDIEGGDDSGYVYAFNKLHTLFKSDSSKKYYLSGAPQCSFPGGGYMTNTLPKAWFDMVWPQFYNNYCGLTTPSAYNFGEWDTWATTSSINPNVKVYLGAAASATAGNGYVDQSTLDDFISKGMTSYKTFGGVMFWDASQAWHNDAGGTNYGVATKNHLSSKGSCNAKPKPPTTTRKTKTASGKPTATTSITRTSTRRGKTTTSANVTKTTSVTTPSSTGLPACNASNNGAFHCTDPSKSPNYSECVNGQWSAFTCSPGTVCVPSGSTMTCGFP